MTNINKKKLNELLEENKKKSFVIAKKTLKRISDYFKNAPEKIKYQFESSIKDTSLKQSRIWAKSITWSLLSGTAFGITWLAIAKTEEIVIVQGKLEPIGGVIEVKIPIQGITEKILIKEGEKVKKEQVLIRMDTSRNLSERNFLERNLELKKDILERLKVLLEEGAVSELQYLNQKNEIEEIKNRINQNEITLKYQEIKAPIDGFIFDLKPKEAGYVASTSEPLLKIVPQNKLKAKVEINSQKIGFIRVGQKTDISIDSFPASDFGVINGRVIRIGSDALAPNPSLNKGFRFPAEIEIDNQYLLLKNGKKLTLQPGMSLTANIKLRKVSYLKLLLGTFQDKADSLRSI